MKTALVIMAYPLLALVTWIFFLAVMQLRARRHALPPFASSIGHLILWLGCLTDFMFNMLSSLPFLELPREFLFSDRIRRHMKSDAWRGTLSRWFARELLDSIDPGHCD